MVFLFLLFPFTEPKGGLRVAYIGIIDLVK